MPHIAICINTLFLVKNKFACIAMYIVTLFSNILIYCIELATNICLSKGWFHLNVTETIKVYRLTRAFHIVFPINVGHDKGCFHLNVSKTTKVCHLTRAFHSGFPTRIGLDKD